MPSILSYAKSQELENDITQRLIEKFSYLVAVREEIADDLKYVDEAMDEIIEEMKDAGFEFDD